MAEDTQENDRVGLGKAIGLVIYIFLIFFLTFLVANADASVKATADFYFKLGMFGILLVIADIAIKRIAIRGRTDVDVPDTITHEFKSPIFGSFPRWVKILVIGGSLIAGGLYAMSVSNQNIVALISSPSFQAVQLGQTGEAILSGIAGIQEDLFFWGGMAGVLFSIFILIFKSKWIPLAIIFFLVPTIFMFYHIGRYGENATALNSVLFFGFIAMGVTLITGSLITAHAIHFANNAAITFFSQTGTDISLILWLYLALVIMLTIIIEVKWGFKGGN